MGRKDSFGNVYVYVNDTDTEVMLSKRGLRHSLDRRLSIIAPVTENIGPIIKNSVRINELSPEFETIKNSYVLVGIAKNQKNEPYVVSFVVNRASNEVMSVDVLYAVNAKKKRPLLSSQSFHHKVMFLLPLPLLVYPIYLIMSTDITRIYCRKMCSDTTVTLPARTA